MSQFLFLDTERIRLSLFPQHSGHGRAINHITFEDNEVYETGANALALNSGNSDSMVLRRNHIHHTGLDTSSPTTGEGMYLAARGKSRCDNFFID
jgi:hypothetical protein